MQTKSKPQSRNAPETKARILEAAEAIFAEKGYSQTGLRDIAARADVATSLVIKYFDTKANLFEQALQNALKISAMEGSVERYGEILVEAVTDPSVKIAAPAMIALSLGDDEAREISSRVIRDDIITRLSQWIGPPQARARAANFFLLSMGFAMFTRYLNVESSKASGDATAKWVARTLQDIISEE